jgi:hypothetical protein
MISIVNTLHFGVSLFALWLLYFIAWREHRLDAFRQRLFAVRDELFDFALAGEIAFDDSAYITLRNLANGMIRYAHRLNFSRVLVLLICSPPPQTNRMEAWMKDVQSRPQNVRKQLLKAHSEIARAILSHIVPWSPLAWLCLTLAIPITMIAGILKIRVSVVKTADEIPAVLEQEALEQQEIFEYATATC